MPRKPKPQPKQKQKHDPDSWLRKLHTPDDVKKWLATERDYISEYLVTQCMAAAEGPKGVSEQVKRMAEVIELIPDNIVRNCYYDDVGKAWGAFKKNYKLQKRDAVVALPKLEKLAKDDRAAFFDWGFWEADGAYWTFSQGQQKVRICNFTINILYFVRSETEPKYVCIFRSAFGTSYVSSVTTDDFTTVGTFKKVVGRLNLVFEGTDAHLNKIKLKLFYGVKHAQEPKYMGYNPHGDFYTWANGLYYKGEFHKTDKYGMVSLKHPISTMEDFMNLPPESHVDFGGDVHVLESAERFIEKNGEDVVSQYINQGAAHHLSFYFLPFSTTLKVTDHDDDDFEFERRFRYSPKTELTFEKWAKLMKDVYGNNGCLAVAYYCMSVYRDIVFRGNNSYIPILGFFGPRGSGKSTCARSLSKMFGEGLEDGVNLESGSTATGVRRYLASMQNAILWLNEFKNTLPDSTLGMIKGIADGSGKLTGRNTGGNETKTYKPRCAVVLCGQDIPTKDPAILSRLIVCEFDGKHRNYDAQTELLEYEKALAGTNVTLELLRHRDLVKKYYREKEPEVTRAFRENIKAVLNKDAEDRLALNCSSVYTVTGILMNVLKFPFTEEDLNDMLLSMLETQINIQATSDDVEQYFNVVQSLINHNHVREDEHYMIRKEDGIRKLYLRPRPFHAEYMGTAQRAGLAAISLGTLLSYLQKHKSYLDYKKDGVFFRKFGTEGGRTSAYIFNYDILLDQGIEFKVNSDIDGPLI